MPEHDVAPVGRPLVSVIVGAYNHEAYLRECLDSIAGGSYPNSEIIVFNDASSDASARVIRDWIAAHPEQRVQFIDHASNVGLTRSLNEAIALAHGEYCCLISADDVMLPNGVGDRVAYLEEHPGKLAVFADSHVIDTAGKQIAESALVDYYEQGDKWWGGLRKKDLFKIDELMAYNIVFHWSVPGPVFMCRRRTFDEMGRYDESLAAEDFDMYLRLAASGKIGFLDRYVASYRKHQASMTLSDPRRVYNFLARSAEKNLHRYGFVCRLKLKGYIHHSKYLESRTPLTRIWHFLLYRGHLLIAWRLYLIRRAQILKTYRLGDSPT